MRHRDFLFQTLPLRAQGVTVIDVIGGFNLSGMYKSATQSVAERWQRFRATPGVQGSLASEREQAMIRIAIGIIGYGYYLVHQFAG